MYTKWPGAPLILLGSLLELLRMCVQAHLAFQGKLHRTNRKQKGTALCSGDRWVSQHPAPTDQNFVKMILILLTHEILIRLSLHLHYEFRFSVPL